jgi:hypothetical protein
MKPIGLSTEPELESIQHDGSIVIRLGLRGIVTVQIAANESAKEAKLIELLASVRPILHVLNRTVLDAEPNHQRVCAHEPRS